MNNKSTNALKRKSQEVTENLLPTRSKVRYDEAYLKFCQWLDSKSIKPCAVSEEVLLVYLDELSKSYSPNTVWSKFSMIKSCLKIYENLDPPQFLKCIEFLKRQSAGYTPTKASVFTAEEVAKFLVDAPDEEWLLSKVVLIFGVFGACQQDDLRHLTVGDVVDNGNCFTVFVKYDNHNKNRSFKIADQESSLKPCHLVRKYVSLRPQKMLGLNERFFVLYRKCKCIAQHVGEQTLAAVPKKVAAYLGLPNPNRYTGSLLIRTSATLLAENDCNLWVRNSVTEKTGEGNI